MSTTATNYPANALQFTLSADQLRTETQRLIDQSNKIHDEVAALPEDQRNFDTVVMRLMDDESVFGTHASNITFPGHVSAVKEIRDASTDAEEALDKFSIESSMRMDLYEAVKTVKERQYGSLDGDQKRLLDRMLRDFERLGLNLSQERRDRVKELKNRLSALGIKYQKNLNEENSKHWFTRDELEGLPDDFVDNLARDEEGEHKGQYGITLKVPEVVPVMQFCRVEETRKRLEKAYASRCQEENVPLFEEAVLLRQQLAETLGYETHAHNVLHVRMAKSPDTVREFLGELRTKLEPFGRKELERLVGVKNGFLEQRGEKSDGRIAAYDYNFYHTYLKEKEYQVNEELIKDYFPLDHVFAQLLQFAQETFGLKFSEVTGAKQALWHADVRHYAVFDSESNDFCGEFYLDLFPREGKYSHFAAFPLQPTYIRPDGTRQYPVSAMVCNFTKPTKDKPSLLKHNEVVTLLHEFGHLMHGFLSKAKYGRFSGTSVERDFVETPSQMMENFCYEKEFLNRVSKHYTTGEPLPVEVVNKLIAAKNVNVALFNLRQLFFGIFDLTVHTQPEGKANTAELYAKLRNEISLLPNTEGTNGMGSFAHLMGGYDVGYYGYLWSEVYSSDVYEEFKKAGVFSPEVGKRYRRAILEQGGMKDGDVLLRDFLQREPSNEAFLRGRGLITAYTEDASTEVPEKF